jgi:hypothetical protein
MNPRALRFIVLYLFLHVLPASEAHTLPPDGEGVEVVVPLKIKLGQILSVPPSLPVPVLPGTKVRLTLEGLSDLQVSDITWAKNLVALSSHAHELVLDEVTEADTGEYKATVSTSQGDVALAYRVLHVSPFPRQRLLNISTRTSVSADAPIVIAGFVVDAGPGDPLSSKQLLIRTVGPSLADYGVAHPLVDPTLRLYRSDGTVIDVSPTLSDPDHIAEAAQHVGAAPLHAGAADAGVLISLRGGVYSAHVTSAGNHAGEVLIEIYEVPALHDD